MKSPSMIQGRHAVLALALLSACAVPMAAQLNGNIRSTFFVTIKADRLGDFQAAVKENMAVLKKANWDKGSTVWRSLTGPNEFRLTQFSEKWAELDITQDPKLKEVSADLTRIGARINQCVEKNERVITEVLPDLSLPRTADPPTMIRVMRSLVRADKVNDYLALVKSDVVPAVKKGQLKVFSVARTRYGAPVNEIVSVTGLQSWADLDGASPLVEGMGGREKYDAFLAKVTPMIIRTQVDVYRYQPELSYTPAK